MSLYGLVALCQICDLKNIVHPEVLGLIPDPGLFILTGWPTIDNVNAVWNTVLNNMPIPSVTYRFFLQVLPLLMYLKN